MSIAILYGQRLVPSPNQSNSKLHVIVRTVQWCGHISKRMTNPWLSLPSFMLKTLPISTITNDHYTSPNSKHPYATISTVWHKEDNLLVLKVKPQKWIRTLLHHVGQMLEISDRCFIKSNNLPTKVAHQQDNCIRRIASELNLNPGRPTYRQKSPHISISADHQNLFPTSGPIETLIRNAQGTGTYLSVDNVFVTYVNVCDQNLILNKPQVDQYKGQSSLLS